MLTSLPNLCSKISLLQQCSKHHFCYGVCLQAYQTYAQKSACSDIPSQSNSYYFTRTMHAHDASRRTVPVRIAHAGRPEISQSSRTTTVESSIKSEHNLYVACEDSPQHAFFFCTFSCSLPALLASTAHWLCCFLFLNAANHRLRSVLDSAKHVRCGGPAVLSYPFLIVKKRPFFPVLHR